MRNLCALAALLLAGCDLVRTDEAHHRGVAAGNTCFYYCVEHRDGNYWRYGPSDCTANRCDLGGQSSAGTCDYPSNLVGTCR